jgi:amino acid transporter
LGIFILIKQFKDFDILLRIKEDSSLLIPISLTFFSIMSLLFNINKLQKHLISQSTIYEILRIGDVVFSISMFIFSTVCIYFFVESLDKTTLEFNNKLLIWSALVVVILFSILLFLDNIFFHKEQENILKKDSIDEIGV